MNKKDNLDFLNKNLNKTKLTVEKLNKRIKSLNERIAFIESIEEADLEDIFFDKLNAIDRSQKYSKATNFHIKIEAPEVYITLWYVKKFNKKDYTVTFDRINICNYEFNSKKDYEHILLDLNKTLKLNSIILQPEYLVSKELNDKIVLSLKSNATKYYSEILKINKEYNYYNISEKSLFYDEYLRLKNLEIFR